jgi:hypothetical protein
MFFLILIKRLKEESFVELDKLVELLAKKSNYKN